MKKLAVLLTFVVAAAMAEPSGFGLGVIVGEPTGLSAKAWLSGNTAADFAAAWSLVEDRGMHIHADFLLHSFNLVDVDPGDLPIYYGIGGRLKLAESGHEKNDVRLGLRVPVGVSYIFETAPFDLFLEVVPLLDLMPATEFGFNGAVGARFYFR